MAGFCVQCGTALPEDARFCAECGSATGVKLGDNPPADVVSAGSKPLPTLMNVRLDQVTISGSTGSGVGALLCVLGAFVVPLAGNEWTGGIRLFDMGRYEPGMGSFASGLSVFVALCALCAVFQLLGRDKQPTAGSRLVGLVGGLAGVIGLLGAILLLVGLISGHWGAGVGSFMLVIGFLLCFAGGMTAASGKA